MFHVPFTPFFLRKLRLYNPINCIRYSELEANWNDVDSMKMKIAKVETFLTCNYYYLFKRWNGIVKNRNMELFPMTIPCSSKFTIYLLSLHIVFSDVLYNSLIQILNFFTLNSRRFWLSDDAFQSFEPKPWSISLLIPVVALRCNLIYEILNSDQINIYEKIQNYSIFNLTS